MADALSTGNKRYYLFEKEPENCARSIYAVLESLWKARAELAKLKTNQ